MKGSLRWIFSSILVACCWTGPAAAARTFFDEAEFQQSVLAPTTVSFNLFSVGFLPQSTLQLGDVTVQLTASGTAPIFGPGPFGFTTNFLSVGVQDGGNNVVITLPAGTLAAGMKIVSVFPVTVTANYASAPPATASFSAGQVSFLGFADAAGLESIRISSPFTPQSTPIVNVGDITYAAGLVPVSVPTLSELGLVVLALSLLFAGGARIRRHGFKG